MEKEAAQMLAIGLAMGLGMIGPGLGLGLIGYSALQGVARNPDARGPILTFMILAAGVMGPFNAQGFSLLLGVNDLLDPIPIFAVACGQCPL